MSTKLEKLQESNGEVAEGGKKSSIGEYEVDQTTFEENLELMLKYKVRLPWQRN